MKRQAFFLLLLLLLIPVTPVGAYRNRPAVVTLNSTQVDSAADIEAAITRVTAQGTRPGVVILDGSHGTFVLTDLDRSVDISVSNLTLRGVKNAVLKDCADGLHFGQYALSHIQIEGITFQCYGNGIVVEGGFTDVSLRGNTIFATYNGIHLAGTSGDWNISGNQITAGQDAIHVSGAGQVIIVNNRLSGSIGVSMVHAVEVTIRHNKITASSQGIQIAQESVNNRVQNNIIAGVSAAGIALESGVTRNRILANRVVCAPAADCKTVDASPDTARANVIAGNQPK